MNFTERLTPLLHRKKMNKVFGVILIVAGIWLFAIIAMVVSGYSDEATGLLHIGGTIIAISMMPITAVSALYFGIKFLQLNDD